MDTKASFDRDGYVVVESGIEHSLLDQVIAGLEPHFGPDGEIPIHVPIAGENRIQDAWHINQGVLAIARAPKILATLEEIYGKKPEPFQTLNFYKGTEQHVHSDSIHFNSEPFGAMCGVWVALEDIGEDQGPLIYYPGSHKLPEMNYDDFGLEACAESYPAYLDKLTEVIKEHDFQPEYGHIKKGQCLIWSANIIHGGSHQNNKDLTRHSQVTHYYLGAPKAWRPVRSNTRRWYFEPPKVEDVSGQPYKYPLQPAPPPSFARRVAGKLKRMLVG